MKKLLPLLLLLALTTACQESLEERCQREAREFTSKHCPTMVAELVRMDSMTFDKASHTICYSYTLSGAVDDAEVISRSNPRQLLLGQVKNSTNLKLYKEAGYNFRYVYYSTKKNGTKLFDATFHPVDYNKQ